MAPSVPATMDEKATADNVIDGRQRRCAGWDGVENERALRMKAFAGNLLNNVEDIFQSRRAERSSVKYGDCVAVSKPVRDKS